jgi:hypothetical protein
MKLGDMSWIGKIDTPVIETTRFVIGSFSHDDEVCKSSLIAISTHRPLASRSSLCSLFPLARWLYLGCSAYPIRFPLRLIAIDLVPSLHQLAQLPG